MDIEIATVSRASFGRRRQALASRGSSDVASLRRTPELGGGFAASAARRALCSLPLMRHALFWLGLLGVLASCGRSEEATRERCRAIASGRNEMGASQEGPGTVLLELLRCDLGDIGIAGGVFREMDRVCGTDSRDLIDAAHVRIEEMYPAEVVALADEAGCAELRLRGLTLFAHPAVARALADRRAQPAPP